VDRWACCLSLKEGYETTPYWRIGLNSWFLFNLILFIFGGFETKDIHSISLMPIQIQRNLNAALAEVFLKQKRQSKKYTKKTWNPNDPCFGWSLGLVLGDGPLEIEVIGGSCCFVEDLEDDPPEAAVWASASGMSVALRYIEMLGS